MAELATMYVSIVASARGLRQSVARELGAAESDARSAGTRAGEGYSAGFSKVSDKIGSILKKGMMVAGAAVGGALTASGVVGVKTAAQLENANIAFTTMLGSGEKAKAFMSDLSKFAAATPFELPGLQQSASQLIAAGVDAKKVIPIMTTLGNATSGMGTGAEGIQRAVVAIQQMNAAQKISAEDLNQLRDAGIPVYDLLAAATGKSKEQVSALVQAGKLGKNELDQLMKALENGTGMERFTGMMEKQSASLAGVWSTLKDTFSIGMAQAIQPIIPMLKDGIGGASNLLAVVLPKVSHFLTEAVGGVVAFGAAWKANDGDITSSGFPGFMERLASIIHNLFDGGKRAIDAFLGGWQNADAEVQASGWTGFLITAGASIRDAFDRLSPIIGPLIPQFRDAWSAASPLSIAFQTLVDTIPNLIEIASQLLETFGKLTSDGLDIISPALEGVSDTVSNALAPAMDGLTGFFADNETASNLLAGAIIGTKLAMEGYQVATKVATAVTTAWKTITSIITGIQMGYSAALGISTAMTQAQAAATQKGTAGYIAMRVAQVATAAWTGIVTAAQWAWNAALNANPIGLVILGIAALVAGLVWFFTQTELGRQIIQTVWAAIQTAIGAVASWFQTVVVPGFQAAINWIGNAVTWLYQNIIKPVFENFIAPALDAFGRIATFVFQAVVAIIQRVIAPAIQWFYNGVIKPQFDAIGAVINWVYDNVIAPMGRNWDLLTKALAAGIQWFYSSVIKPTWDAIGAAINWVYNNVIQPAISAFQWYIKNILAPVLNWFWNNIVRPVWDGIGASIKWVWDNVISPVFSWLSDTIQHKIPDAFKTGVDMVKSWWDGLTEIAKKPIRFVVEAINNGLVHPLNGIADFLHIGRLPDVALPPGFANGGYTGSGGKYQVAGLVHAGEYVFTQEQVGAAGGPGILARLAAALTRGYAAGGLVSPLDHWTLTQGYSGLSGHNGIDMAAPMGTPIHAAGPGIVSFAGWGYGGLGGNEMHVDHPNGLQTWYAHQSAFAVPQGSVVQQGQTIGFVGMTGAASGPHLHYMVLHGGWPNVTDPTPYLTGGGEDGGSGGGPFNPIAGFINGIMDQVKSAFPGAGFFVDFVGGMAKKLVSNVADMVGKMLFGQQDAPNGSVTTFDGGGWLRRTAEPFLAQHNPTRPDAVLTDAQWGTMLQIADGASAGGELTGELYLDSGEFLGTVRGIVHKELDGAAKDASRRRMGVGL